MPLTFKIIGKDYVAAIDAAPKLFYEISLLCSKLYKEKFSRVEKKLSFLNLGEDDLKKLLLDAKSKKMNDSEKSMEQRKGKKTVKSKGDNSPDTKRKRTRGETSKGEKKQSKAKRARQASNGVADSAPNKGSLDSFVVKLETAPDVH